MAVNRRDGGMPAGLPHRGGMGWREGGLSPQVETPGCPPIQSHDGSPMSSSRSKAKKEKLMTKVVWGQESRVSEEKKGGGQPL